MSDFLAGALSQARADLTSKRSSGTLYGGKTKPEGPAKKKSKWLTTAPKAQRAKSEVQKDSLGLSDYDIERSRKALERKEKEYRKMFNRGTDMGLSGDAADNLLIDFDRKWAEGHRQEDSSDDASMPSDDENDPLIEVEDEFGRLKRVRKSQALRHERPNISNPRPANLIYGRHLQTFNPDARKKDEIWAEEEASKEVHYDPNFEIRQRGTGYINLGRGQDRQDRMNDLSDSRDKTVNARQAQGLTDPEPPPLTTIRDETKPSGQAPDVHPSRKSLVPTNNPDSLHEDPDSLHESEAARNEQRIQAGQAFLDTIL